MPFKKGHKLSNGRPKGSENKISSEIKYKLQDLMSEAFTKIDIAQMNQVQLLKLIQIGVGYLIPKLKYTEISEEENLHSDWIEKVMSTDPKELHKKISQSIQYRHDK